MIKKQKWKTRALIEAIRQNLGYEALSQLIANPTIVKNHSIGSKLFFEAINYPTNNFIAHTLLDLGLELNWKDLVRILHNLFYLLVDPEEFDVALFQRVLSTVEIPNTSDSIGVILNYSIIDESKYLSKVMEQASRIKKIQFNYKLSNLEMHPLLFSIISDRTIMNREKILRWLIEKGWDLNVPAGLDESEQYDHELWGILYGDINYGETPIAFAARNAEIEIVLLFLSKGADPTIKDRMGFCAIDYVPDEIRKIMLRGIYLQ